MFIGGEGDLTLSKITKPSFPIVTVDHRTGEPIVEGHLRVIPFKGLKDRTTKRLSIYPGVSEGGLEVLPVTTTETLQPTAGA